MTNPQWHTIVCLDCKTALAFSVDPILLSSSIEVRCYLCAHAHAQVATWMMPIGNNLATNFLYGVNQISAALTLRIQFERIWSKLYAKLEKHRIAKAEKKLHANKITLDTV